MRVVTLAKLALLGTAIGAFVIGFRSARRRRLHDEPDLPDGLGGWDDPRDRVQRIDDIAPFLEDFEVDARANGDEEERLAEVLVDPALFDDSDADIERAVRDSGELYGLHTPPAVDRDIPDDDRAQAEGENWLEALASRAGEAGPEPEHVIDIVDDADLESPPSDRRDRPVADRGSGGPRGL